MSFFCWPKRPKSSVIRLHFYKTRGVSHNVKRKHKGCLNNQTTNKSLNSSRRVDAQSHSMMWKESERVHNAWKKRIMRLRFSRRAMMSLKIFSSGRTNVTLDLSKTENKTQRKVHPLTNPALIVCIFLSVKKWLCSKLAQGFFQRPPMKVDFWTENMNTQAHKQFSV